MGIVLRQSFINTVIIFIGFAVGGINVLFLFTHFLHEDYFGLITFLLSAANIILPLVVFGMQHTIIKFYFFYKTKQEQDGFLITALFFPLVIIIPLALVGSYFYVAISNWLSVENSMLKEYTYLIFLAAIFMGYFELFHSWTKVQLNTIFGNFIKELFARICTSFLLLAVYFQWITNEQFIYAEVIVYGLRAFIMMFYAFYVYKPVFKIKLPANLKEILSFSFYIIVGGSAAGILLEIDKFMIPQMQQIAQVAYYSVGIYIASVISIPTRAMQQITSPITAKDMIDNNVGEVEKLYKQTSINLLIIGGLLFLMINLNIADLYEIINKPQFTQGILVVLIISFANIMELALGTGNAILVNSKYYRIFFYMSIAMALSVVFLNKWLIALIGINGAAYATLSVAVVYGFVKIFYIKYKFKIQPFSIDTIKILVVIGFLFVAFYFWNFKFIPIVNILLKCLIILILYVFLIKKLKISKDINTLLLKFPL